MVKPEITKLPRRHSDTHQQSTECQVVFHFEKPTTGRLLENNKKSSPLPMKKLKKCGAIPGYQVAEPHFEDIFVAQRPILMTLMHAARPWAPPELVHISSYII
jgi:hypothetical protein